MFQILCYFAYSKHPCPMLIGSDDIENQKIDGDVGRKKARQAAEGLNEWASI